MFEIKKNTFFENNTCNYADEYNNTAFMKRTENGFVAKLRFSNQEIKSEPMTIELFKGEEKEGDFLRLHYTDEKVLDNEDVKKGIENFTLLINYWVSMLYDIKLLDLSDSYFLKANPGLTSEDVANHKYSLIKKYKELEILANLVGL